jgi:hypothetical protein
LGGVLHDWLLSEGFERTNVDRRLFIRRRGDRWLIAAVLVDDSLFLGCDAAEVGDFLVTWHAKFASSITKAREDVITFGGVNYHRKGDTVEVSCDRLLGDLAALIRSHGPTRPEEVPMTFAAFAAIREESEREEALVVLGPCEVRAAQTLLGLGGWITANNALEATFAYSVLASRVAHYLTPVVWKAVLQWANYLVATKGLRLTFCANGAENEIEIVTDSSAHNAGAGKSWGGYAFAHAGGGSGRPTSGAFAVKCLTPKTLGGSLAATELIMATEALKACFGWRMLMTEIGFKCEGAIRFGMDANAVLLGTKRGKVTRCMKYMARRYAMMRDGVENGVIVLHEIPTELNCADLFTKPVVGLPFQRLRALLLGLEL